MALDQDTESWRPLHSTAFPQSGSLAMLLERTSCTAALVVER
jgi:hypothetical protein